MQYEYLQKMPKRIIEEIIMIQLNFWFFLVVFIAVDIVAIACYIIGQGIGKARLIGDILIHLSRKPPYLKEYVKEFEDVIWDLADGGIA